MENSDPPFGSLLKSHRLRQGVTQKELSVRSTLSTRSIRNLESGKGIVPRRQTIRLLADALHLSEPDRAEFLAAGNPYDTDHVRAPMRRWHAMPFPRSSGPLLGREQTVRLVVRLLRSGDSRWIVLSGVAGVGKTRVAQAVAEELHAADQYPVVWADRQAPIARRAPAADGGTRGRILHLLRQRAVDELATLVGDLPVLIVLDGGAAAWLPDDAVTRLVDTCPRLMVLAGARCPEQHPASSEVPIMPLAVPGPVSAGSHRLTDYPAVALLLYHLRRLRPDVPLTEARMLAVAHVARALDGIPLALRAAAAWLPLYDSQRLVELAQRRPFTLVEPIAEEHGDYGAALVQDLTGSIGSLSPPHSDALHVMAGFREPWTLEAAARKLRSTDTRTAPAVTVLLRRGLIRPAQREDGEFGEFEVLNLVRHLLGRRSGSRSMAA